MTRLLNTLALALRNLGRQRRRSAVAGLSLALGVVALMLTMGIARGFVHYITHHFVRQKVGGVQVHKAGYLAAAQASPLDRVMADDAAFRARLLAVPGVTAVSGRLIFTGFVSNGRGQVPFLGTGLEPKGELAVCPRAYDEVSVGEHALPDDGALLSEKLVKSLKLAPGEPVTFSSQSASGRGNAFPLKLAGMFVPSLPLDAQRVATVPLAMAQSLTGMEGQVTEFALGLDDLTQAPEVARAVQAALGPEYEVHPWGERVPFFKDGIAYIEGLVGMVAALLFLVVVAGIANAQLMSVLERQREIGTALAVGMRRREVRLLFLAESLVLGALGALAGALLGAALVMLLARVGLPMRYFGFNGNGVLQMQIDGGFTVLVMVGTAAAAVVAGLMPAWRASKLAPVEALRGR
jgi:putative ABC transport system permease protein